MIEILEMIRLVAIALIRIISFILCVKAAFNYATNKEDITNLEATIILAGFLV